MNEYRSLKGHGKRLAFFIVVVGLCSGAILWGWNTFAVEVFFLAPIRFKHALALEFSILGVAAAFPVAWRMLAHKHD